MFTDDYPKETEKEQKRKLSNGEKQSQSQELREEVENESVGSDIESLLSKIKPRISDCGLSPVHSKRIEGE